MRARVLLAFAWQESKKRVDSMPLAIRHSTTHLAVVNKSLLPFTCRFFSSERHSTSVYLLNLATYKKKTRYAFYLFITKALLSSLLSLSHSSNETNLILFSLPLSLSLITTAIFGRFLLSGGHSHNGIVILVL